MAVCVLALAAQVAYLFTAGQAFGCCGVDLHWHLDSLG